MSEEANSRAVTRSRSARRSWLPRTANRPKRRDHLTQKRPQFGQVCRPLPTQNRRRGVASRDASPPARDMRHARSGGALLRLHSEKSDANAIRTGRGWREVTGSVIRSTRTPDAPRQPKGVRQLRAAQRPGRKYGVEHQLERPPPHVHAPIAHWFMSIAHDLHEEQAPCCLPRTRTSTDIGSQDGGTIV